MRPGLTPESRENQMISLAVDMAEEQLRNRTASSQVLVHYLRMGTTKMALEKEKLENENLLLKAKTDAIEAQKKYDEKFEEVIRALRTYQGNGEEDEYY